MTSQVVANSQTKIIEMALQKIGAFSINSTAARPRDLARSYDWLDLVVRHKSSTHRFNHLTPTRVPVTLTASLGTYDLPTLLGSDLPPGGVQWLIGASLTPSGTTSEVPLEIMRRHEWEAITDKTREGQPEFLFFERDDTDETVYLYPVPNAAHTMTLVLQRFNKPIDGQDPTRIVGVRASWDLWLTHALAAMLGDGPIRRLQDHEIKGLREQERILWNDLITYDALEQADETFRRVEYIDF